MVDNLINSSFFQWMRLLSADENNKIFKFEEKPKNPTSTKASMGIYIFNKDVLFKYLEEDANTEGSANDFGKNIIPTMLERGEKKGKNGRGIALGGD